MPSLALVATITLVLTLTLFALVVLAKLLGGQVNTDGMLSTDGSGSVDPERLLVLIATVMGGFAYFSYGLSHGLTSGQLPPIPDDIVTAMGGGNVLYLSGKIFRRGQAK